MTVCSSLRTFRFALAAFLAPLGIRAVPDVLVGPYQVGWDTIAFYVPNTLRHIILPVLVADSEEFKPGLALTSVVE